ncbi:MAG: hypothetical protein RSF67_07055 [Clostridia bacterium]
MRDFLSKNVQNIFSDSLFDFTRVIINKTNTKDASIKKIILNMNNKKNLEDLFHEKIMKYIDGKKTFLKSF